MQEITVGSYKNVIIEDMNIAYFISSHGFGHAARSSAIINCLLEKEPSLHFEVFSGTARWFFEDSFVSHYDYHSGAVDVGLVQKSPMEQDLPRTIVEVNRYLDSIPERAVDLAKILRQKEVRLVVCDISPLGIAAARAAGIPSILFENFTWDWIYQPLEKDFPEFHSIDQRMAELFAMAGYRLQSEPLCAHSPRCDCLIPPVSRKPREDVTAFRARLGVPENHRMGLISMGGIPENFDFVMGHTVHPDVTLVVPGTFEKVTYSGQMILLPHHSDFYHPDLVNAADFVIGKAGYSTIGEVCASGSAYGYILRDDFRESDVTAAFLRKRTNTLEVQKADFDAFNLDTDIEKLLDLGRVDPLPVNGCDTASDYILKVLNA